MAISNDARGFEVEPAEVIRGNRPADDFCESDESWLERMGGVDFDGCEWEPRSANVSIF